MSAFEIRRIDANGLPRRITALAMLLIDIVENGASVGFVLPLSQAEAADYWRGLRDSIASGSRLLWTAERDGAIVGTVQLELVMKKNGVNRAEVQKLLVASSERRSGAGRALMQAAEQSARELRRGLLYLDTEAGSGAEAFYRTLGYTYVGGLPQYACSPEGEWRANAIYYKTLFTRPNE
jgi:acetyltransferase